MYQVGKILGYKVTENGTEFKILIPDTNLLEFINKKMAPWCNLYLEDGRHISPLQVSKIHATLQDIADYTGYSLEEQKKWMKILYMDRTGGNYLSFAKCSMDEAREFINVMLDYVIENGIPLCGLGVERTDDIGRYLYMCLKHKRCCICGRKGEVHHVDTIGMGGNRNKVDDSDYRKICLCRQHHTESHQIGNKRFEKRYKVYGIVLMEDKTA